MKTSEMMKAILYGVAVGDALGFPVQFQSRSARKRMPVTGMGTYLKPDGSEGRFDEDETGLWSDDTSLTLCLAESLLNGFDLKDQAERFVAWLYKSYLSALDEAFDVGHTTSVSLAKVKRILERGDCSLLQGLGDNMDAFSNGNGSLMRILPLLIAAQDLDMDFSFETIWQASALTHPHIRAAFACYYYLMFARALTEGTDKRKAMYIASLQTMAVMEGQVLPQGEKGVFERLLLGTIDKEEEDDIRSDGYVISSLEASIWCLLNTESYSEAVLRAVNLGGDTDTTGAITGGLAALLYGFESIPQEWIKALKKPHLFERILKGYRDRERG